MKKIDFIKQNIWDGNTILIWDVLNWISKDTIHIPDRCDYCSRELMYDGSQNTYRCPSPLCGFRFEVDNEIDDIRTDLVTWVWKYFDKPIEEQSVECINFIYEILKNKE